LEINAQAGVWRMSKSGCRASFLSSVDTSSSDKWSAIWLHHDSLLRLALPRVSSESDAEDVVHEAMALAAAKPDLDLDTAGAWLNRVVRNRCADLARERSYSQKCVVYEHGRARVQSPTEEGVCDRAEAAFLNQLLQTLPSRQHEALLHASEGMSNAQIATVMSTTVKAIESLLVKARRTLRTAAAAVVAGFAWVMRRRSAGPTSAVGLAALSISVAVLIAPSTPQETPALSPAQSIRDDAATHAVAVTRAGLQHSAAAHKPRTTTHHATAPAQTTAKPRRVDVTVSVGPHHRGATVTFLQDGNPLSPAVMPCVRQGVEVSLDYIGCKAFK
jgi:RNA polymerase sigma factor (sigma-70 family)